MIIERLYGETIVRMNCSPVTLLLPIAKVSKKQNAGGNPSNLTASDASFDLAS